MRMRISSLAAAVFALAVSSDVFAQVTPPGGATPPAAPQRGRGGRGGGRGRAVVAMTLSSSGFKDGTMLPSKYSQAGEELSPPLAWSGAPDSTKSFVLIVHDLDAAVGGSPTEDVLHWMVWNIPATTTALPEAVPQGAESPMGVRQISVTGPYYRGPAAPATGPIHHYEFDLFAVDTLVDVPAVGASPALTRAAVLAAMAGHVRGKGVAVALYRRSP